MALTLTIENETQLPDGGSLSVTVTGKRSIDIGRDAHLDWTLPDPSRSISGKHCEIRCRDGAYRLHDVSTNGIYLNRGEGRMQGPHRLRTGDRVEIGHYVIAVALTGDDVTAPAPAEVPGAEARPDDLWSGSEVTPPIPARDLVPREQLRPVRPDFLDWAIDAGAAPRASALRRPRTCSGPVASPRHPRRPSLPQAGAAPPGRHAAGRGPVGSACQRGKG